MPQKQLTRYPAAAWWTSKPVYKVIHTVLNLYVTRDSGEPAYLSQSIACVVNAISLLPRLEQLLAKLPRYGMGRTAGMRAAC